MDDNKKLDDILSEFLTREIDATDSRILSIRYFIQTLELSIEREFSSVIDENSRERAKLVALVSDMVSIYEGEIDTLVLKRNKISEHLPSVRSDVSASELSAHKIINSILN